MAPVVENRPVTNLEGHIEANEATIADAKSSAAD